MDDESIKIQCAREAIAALGLLLPEAAPKIAALMDFHDGRSLVQIATAYRKAGAQIPDAAKKSIGIRKNAFMSIEALTDLDERGLIRPLAAHELTLLRAMFSYIRYKKFKYYSSYKNTIIRYDCLNITSCAGCRRIAETEIDPSSFSELPPTDCETETCNTGIIGRFKHLPNTRGDFSAWVVDYRPNGSPGKYFFNFELNCDSCGGYTISMPDNDYEHATCASCGISFGTAEDVRQRCRETAMRFIAEKGLPTGNEED